MIDYIIGIGVVLILILIVRRGIKKSKSGSHGCCGCSSCPSSQLCGKEEE